MYEKNNQRNKNANTQNLMCAVTPPKNKNK